MASKVLYTLLAATLVVLLFVTIDSVMGRSLETVIWTQGIERKVAKYALEIFVAGVALALTKSNAYRTLFLALLCLLDMVWYGSVIYFHAPLEPHHLLLAVHEVSDVWNEFTAKLPHFLPYFGFIAMAYGVTGFALRRLQPRTLHLSYAPAIVVAVLLAEPTMIYASNVDVRYYPSPARPPLSNVIRTISIAAITASEQALGVDSAPDFEETRVEPIETDGAPLTVAVVMGESISGYRLHILGSKRQTTPRIERWLEASDGFRLIPRGGFSASTATRSTMPLFLNAHWHPRDLNLSYKRPANLFALAKRNGFQTYIYSVQRRHILMLGGLELVDSISTVDERWNEFKQRQDDLLLDDLAGMPDAPRRFVFLHQHVNHAPYGDHCRHAPETEVFTAEGSSLDDQRVAEYDNGLRCYDRNLAGIFDYFARQAGAVYVFVTADHNDLAGEFGKWGHLHDHPSNAYVPMMLFTNRPDGPIAQAFRDVGVMTHFEMSRLVARALGFEVIDPNVRPDTFFVSSSGGFGRDGYLEVRAMQEPNNYEVIQRSGRDQVLRTSQVDLTLDE